MPDRRLPVNGLNAAAIAASRTTSVPLFNDGPPPFSASNSRRASSSEMSADQTVRGSHHRVKSVVRVGEPLRAGVVEVRQGALLEGLLRIVVARNRTLRVAGNRPVDPLDPFGRVEPAVAQLDQPLSFPGLRP